MQIQYYNMALPGFGAPAAVDALQHVRKCVPQDMVLIHGTLQGTTYQVLRTEGGTQALWSCIHTKEPH